MPIRILLAGLLALPTCLSAVSRPPARATAAASQLPDGLPPPEPCLRIASIAEADGLRFAVDGHDERAVEPSTGAHESRGTQLEASLRASMARS